MGPVHFCTISSLPYHAQKFLIWSACGMDEDFFNVFFEHYDGFSAGNTGSQDTYARIALKLGVRPKSLCLYSADEKGDDAVIHVVLLWRLIAVQILHKPIEQDVWQAGVICFESGQLRVQIYQWPGSIFSMTVLRYCGRLSCYFRRAGHEMSFHSPSRKTLQRDRLIYSLLML